MATKKKKTVRYEKRKLRRKKRKFKNWNSESSTYRSKKLSKVKKAPPPKMKMPFTASLTADKLQKNLGREVYMAVAYKSPHGIDRDLDLDIEKVARHKSYASGLGFDDGIRDVSFHLKTKQAFDAAKRIKKALPKVKIGFITAEDF